MHPNNSLRTSAPKSKAKEPPPKYFYLSPRGGIDIDPKKSCTDAMAIDKRYVPLPESWSGQHVFSVRGFFWLGIFCSEEFVDVAVAQRWTGVGFHAMDVTVGPHFGWDGIDLKTREWRKTIYPPVPQQDEIPARIEDLALGNDDRTGRRYDARLFFFALGLGQNAVEPLVRAFEAAAGQSAFKQQLAEVLNGLSKQGHSINPSVLLRIRRYLEKQGE
jgi:hypothetical protein